MINYSIVMRSVNANLLERKKQENGDSFPVIIVFQSMVDSGQKFQNQHALKGQKLWTLPT